MHTEISNKLQELPDLLAVCSPLEVLGRPSTPLAVFRLSPSLDRISALLRLWSRSSSVGCGRLAASAATTGLLAFAGGDALGAKYADEF